MNACGVKARPDRIVGKTLRFVNSGSAVTAYFFISRPRFAYSLYNFHGATMTITGNLHVTIAIVKAFLTRNFLGPVKNWPENCAVKGKWG